MVKAIAHIPFPTNSSRRDRSIVSQQEDRQTSVQVTLSFEVVIASVHRAVRLTWMPAKKSCLSFSQRRLERLCHHYTLWCCLQRKSWRRNAENAGFSSWSEVRCALQWWQCKTNRFGIAVIPVAAALKKKKVIVMPSIFADFPKMSRWKNPSSEYPDGRGDWL